MIPVKLKKYFLPALLVYSKKEALQKLAFVKKHFPNAILHVDVMDNEFVSSTCWCKPHDFKNLRITQPFEVHLMTAHPERRISAWKRAGATRIIFHYEAVKNHRMIITVIHNAGLEAIIALNPETPLKKIKLLAGSVDDILLMGVTPGWSGQRFKQFVFKKIRLLHAAFPKKNIIIDGGVTAKNAPALITAGARQLVSTSAVYGSGEYARKQKTSTLPVV